MNLILGLCLILIQIVFCVITVIKNAKWKWLYAFLGISYVVSVTLVVYFESLPGEGFMPGLSHLGDVLTAFTCAAVSVLLLFVSICIKIVRDEKCNNISPLYLLVATVFVFAGCILVSDDIFMNIDLIKEKGVVVGFSEYEGTYSENYPIVEFNVDGKDFQRQMYKEGTYVGDKVDIYVCSNNNGKDYFITYPNFNGYFYIPCFLIGAVFFIIRKKKMHKYE